jgi:hypothetical protein
MDRVALGPTRVQIIIKSYLRSYLRSSAGEMTAASINKYQHKVGPILYTTDTTLVTS